MKSLLVAIPSCHGEASLSTCASAFNIVAESAELGISAGLEFCRGALIYNARRTLLARACEIGVDYLMFLDTDMIIRKGSFPSLFSGLKAGNFTAISGLTCTRNAQEPRMPIAWKSEDGRLDDPPEGVDLKTDIVPVQGFGFAAVLIDLKAMMKILDGPLGLKGDRQADNPFLPDVDHESGTVYSEDLAFCRRLKKGGGRLGVHCGVWVEHFVQVPLNPQHAIMALEMRQAEENTVEESAVHPVVATP